MAGNRRSAGNLQITTVELGDDATYECMVIASAGHPPLTSLPAFLTVQGKLPFAVE